MASLFTVKYADAARWLATQLHARGLKLGLYGCVGVRTCLGFPGQFEHEYQDAATLYAPLPPYFAVSPFRPTFSGNLFLVSGAMQNTWPLD